MEGANESALKQTSISEKIEQRVDAFLSRDPLSQKIIKQFESVARAAGTLDPKKIEAAGKRVAIAGNAVNIVLSVIIGGVGVSDRYIGKKKIQGLKQQDSDFFAYEKAATKWRRGEWLMIASPVLLFVRPIAWATLLAGMAAKPIIERVNGVTHVMTNPSSYAAS